MPRGELSRFCGIKPGENVLFVAGGPGGWAKQLAEEGVNVHYTDASRKIANRVRRRKGKLASVRTFDAARIPSQNYDWVASFEPMPLRETALPLTVLRGLAHARGVKLFYRAMFNREFASRLGFAKLYGARRSSSGAAMPFESPYFKESAAGGLTPAELYFYTHDSFHALTLRSTAPSRQKARLDLLCIRLLQPKKSKPAATTIAALVSHPEVKRLGAGEEKVKASLERITALCECFKPGLTTLVNVE